MFWSPLFTSFISERNLTWRTQYQTCTFLISNSSLMGEKVSEMLLTAQLESSYILHQGQNITNYFTLTGSMDPLAIKHHRMVKTSKMMRRESLDEYDVLYTDFAGTLNTRIFPTSMYTLLNYIKCYVLFKYFMRIFIITCMRTISVLIWSCT